MDSDLENPEESVLSSGSFSLHTSVFPGSMSQLRPAPQRPNHCIATSRKWMEKKRGKTSTTNDITKILFIYTKKEHRKHKTNISKLDNKQRAAPLPHTSPTLCLMFKLQGATTRVLLLRIKSWRSINQMLLFLVFTPNWEFRKSGCFSRKKPFSGKGRTLKDSLWTYKQTSKFFTVIEGNF